VAHTAPLDGPRLARRYHPIAGHPPINSGAAAGNIDDRHGLWRSLVSALDWGSRGREFESPQPDPLSRLYVESATRSVVVDANRDANSLQRHDRRGRGARLRREHPRRSGSPDRLQNGGRACNS
jgi:hypothetical protein